MSAWDYEYGTLWAIDLVKRSPSSIQPRVPATIREVSRQEFPLLAQAMGLPDFDSLGKRFSGRRRCFAAWVDEQIAAYGWVSQEDEWIGEQERCIRISQEEAYIWDCVTLPDYRRQRLYSALLSHMLSVLEDEGLQRVWIGTALNNRPSIKGFINVGFQPVINLLFLRLLNLRVWWLRRRPNAPEALYQAARQALVREDEYTWGPMVIARSPALPLSSCSRVEG